MTETILIKKSKKLAVEVPATFTAAPCRGDNEELFYSYNQDTDADIRAYKARLAKARTICGTCPLARPCAQQAKQLPRASQFGIWAGRDLHREPHETIIQQRYRDRRNFLF